MNRDLLYLDGPSRTCLDSIWRSHAIYGGYGITDLYLLWWMAGSTIMLTVELLSWRIQQIVMFKSNLRLQCDTSPGYLYMMTTQTCGDTLSVQGPMRKSNEMHLLNLGGQNDWGSCLPAFQSLLCVNTKCQSWPLKYFERRYYKLRHIWGKKQIWTTYCCLSFGVLLACERNSKHICVSIIHKRLSYPQRQTNYSAQQASSTDQQVLQALYFMKSLKNGGILLAWAVFLELLLIITLTLWT